MTKDNVALIRSVYEGFAKGDMPSVLGAMAPTIVWNEAENFVYADGNPYMGPDAILKGVFARLGGEWTGFSARADELLDAGETVVALGRYGGVNKKAGARLSAQFAHVWRIKDGKARIPAVHGHLAGRARGRALGDDPRPLR